LQSRTGRQIRDFPQGYALRSSRLRRHRLILIDARFSSCLPRSTSPLLANVYLHYVYDLWVQRWRKRHVTGDMIVVRYADDTIVGFQHRRDAERFLNDLKNRLAQFALSLHPEKTRLIEFGAFAAERRKRRGESKPETFDFLGFTHLCGTRNDGTGFQLVRRTQRKRMRAKPDLDSWGGFCG